MKVAILETGAPPSLLGGFGSYPDMFRQLLGGEYVGTSFDVRKGVLPSEPSDHAAYLITGSAAGVYDDLPWILKLKQFLQEAKGKARLVGICFGHQIMAEAFGGVVAKSPRGWGIGLQEYALLSHEAWMDPGAERIRVPASHQDQITKQPPCSTVLAANDLCEIGALRYDDQPAISFQFHPEFQPEYAAALIEMRRDRLTGPDAAIQTLKGANDSERIGQWIKRFLDEPVKSSRDSRT